MNVEEWCAQTGQSAAAFRRIDEAAAIADMKARAAVPAACGQDIAPAVARGSATPFQPQSMDMDGKGEWDMRPQGYRGRDALLVDDAFAKMAQQCARRGADAPFTPQQVHVGRFYAGLVERFDGSGIKCQNLEGVSAGCGGGDGRMEAVLREADQLRWCHSVIGNGQVLVVRRSTRPSRQSGPAVAVSARDLVDLVCVGEKTLSEILVMKGWSKATKNIKVLRIGLQAALDRMGGG